MEKLFTWPCGSVFTVKKRGEKVYWKVLNGRHSGRVSIAKLKAYLEPKKLTPGCEGETTWNIPDNPRSHAHICGFELRVRRKIVRDVLRHLRKGDDE